MKRAKIVRLGVGGTVVAALGAGLLLHSSHGAATGPAAAVEVRVDQVGYAPDEAKRAFVMGPVEAVRDAGFTVRDADGTPVLSGSVGPRTGSWNGEYPAVHALDITALRKPGSYRISITGTAKGTSVPFAVAPADTLLEPLLEDTVRFFQAQRDGADVIPSVMRRKPSHLTDRRATVYRAPRYDADGEKMLDEGPLTPLGGPVDVEGGWFDAGDFLKFVHTASYSTAQLLLAERARPDTPGLSAEARHGTDWLSKMWDEESGTLYFQVGLGVGNDVVHADHDSWRLPEKDDGLDVEPGDPDHTVKYRPVFRAAEPGARISPNLAGRTAAALALAAQNDARHGPERAHGLLDEAAALYARADTSPSGGLTTALPHAFYPEESWRDDLEFAAVELSLAADALGDDRAEAWLREAGQWAAAHLSSGLSGRLGVADVGAMAHRDLVRAMGSRTEVGGVTRKQLVDDIGRQYADSREQAATEPFRTGAVYDEFDASTHAFALVATERMHREAGGRKGGHSAFATQQRNWALGANPWGVSFLIGAGTHYPRCPEHSVANLAGAGPLRGALVNGPNKAAYLKDLNSFPHMKPCAAAGSRPYEKFDGRGARYLDHVGAWQTNEPADDYTSTALLALALTAGD